MHLSQIHKLGLNVAIGALYIFTGVSLHALDEATLMKMVTRGSTRVIEMEKELARLKNDKTQKEYVRFLKKDITKEKKRSNKTVAAIRNLAKKACKRGDINAQDSEGRTLIMLVAGLGNDDATGLVLKENPDLSIADEHGRIALDYEQRSGGSKITEQIKAEWEKAASSVNDTAIQKAIDSGADPNWSIKNGQQTALELALSNHKNSLVRFLLMHGAKADGQTNAGISYVELAVSQNNTEALSALLSELKEVDMVFSDGSTLFQQLIKAQCPECLVEWLSTATTEGKTENSSGTSYFCMIIRFTPKECAEKVAKKNPKLVTIEDKEGNLPLHEAARRGNVELYRTLKQLGASPMQKNARGETVLMHAALSANADTLNEVLKDITPDILKAKDCDGHTAQYYANLAKDTAAVQALKAAGL